MMNRFAAVSESAKSRVILTGLFSVLLCVVMCSCIAMVNTQSAIANEAATYTAVGASKMPVGSTCTWSLKNASLSIDSGDAVKVKGNVVTAVKAGTATISVRDASGAVVESKKVKVYKLSGEYMLGLGSDAALFLAVKGSSKKKGANLIVENLLREDNEYFTFKDMGKGYYAISNVHSGLYLQVKDGSKALKANIVQQKENGKKSQCWKIAVDSDNMLTLVNKNSGYVLAPAKATPTDGTKVFQAKKTNKSFRKWVVYSAPTEFNRKASKMMRVGTLVDWKVKNGRLVLVSGKGIVKVSSKKIKALAEGTAKVKVVDNLGNKIASYTITVIPQPPKGTEAGMAIAMAAASISYSNTVYQGEGTGTKYYLKVCKSLLGSYYAQNKKQMQCNVPIAASVRLSGVDSDFPTTNQDIYKFLVKSKKWKCLGNYITDVSAADLAPGDILIRIKGTTTYTNKSGKTEKAATNHACIYVGKDIIQSVYKTKLKGTDADKGKPSSKEIFVSAHKSTKDASKRSASCIVTAADGYADRKMLVFRYVG